MKNNEEWTMLERAKYEIELAKKKVMEDKDDFNKYLCVCLDVAFEAYKKIYDNDFFKVNKGRALSHILDNLCYGRPLTAIEDTPEVWRKIGFSNGVTSYVCNRYKNLTKHVDFNENITYSIIYPGCGIDAITGALNDIDLLNDIYNEMFPIKMPFIPPKEKAYVYTADFAFDKKNGDFDTIAVLYIQKGNERIEVNRFFREPYEGNKETYPGWVEIDIGELDYRMKTARVRGNTNMTLDDIGLQELCEEYYKDMDGDYYDYDSQFCENGNEGS